MYLVIVLLGYFLSISIGEIQNVCPTFRDYYTLGNNSNCWYDFSAEFEAPEVIRLNGYPVMEYRVPTLDGFILRTFRIPSKNPNALKFPVFLQHGLVATCDYFIGIKKNSLPFILADAGFDVWLGNYRATTYSQEHTNLTVYDMEYWNHSMDEIVAYDYPALFHTVLSNTDPNGKIIYIGHSLGTTLALMYASEYPQIAKDTMAMMVLMAPAYTLANMKSPYAFAAPFGPAIVNIATELKIIRLLSQSAVLKNAVRLLCLESPPMMQLCLQGYSLFYGVNTQFSPDLIPTYFNHLPGGTSLKVLNHAADLVLGNFRKYNFLDDNYKVYGSEEPPIYDIKKIQVPVYLAYSTQDWATTEKDALNLWHQLPEEIRLGMKRVDLPAFSHMDFVYSKNARTIVYDDILQAINKIINRYNRLLFQNVDHQKTRNTSGK